MKHSADLSWIFAAEDSPDIDSSLAAAAWQPNIICWPGGRGPHAGGHSLTITRRYTDKYQIPFIIDHEHLLMRANLRIGIQYSFTRFEKYPNGN